MCQIDYDTDQPTNRQWKEIVKCKLQTATTFEIHCWEDESEWITLALEYGELKEINWKHGKVIKGKVTQEFVDMLMQLPKPSDSEIYNKMTPFFSIFLNNGFSSEHYGTELNVNENIIFEE